MFVISRTDRWAPVAAATNNQPHCVARRGGCLFPHLIIPRFPRRSDRRKKINYTLHQSSYLGWACASRDCRVSRSIAYVISQDFAVCINKSSLPCATQRACAPNDLALVVRRHVTPPRMLLRVYASAHASRAAFYWLCLRINQSDSRYATKRLRLCTERKWRGETWRTCHWSGQMRMLLSAHASAHTLCAASDWLCVWIDQSGSRNAMKRLRKRSERKWRVRFESSLIRIPQTFL